MIVSFLLNIDNHLLGQVGKKLLPIKKNCVCTLKTNKKKLIERANILENLIYHQPTKVETFTLEKKKLFQCKRKIK